MDNIKDANDLLKVWVGQGVAHEEQVERVRAAMAAAATMVETAAAWAGGQRGAERDAAFRTVFGMIASMDKVQRAQYRQRLVDLLGIGLREFNDIVRAAKDEGGDEEGSSEPVEILGGFIGGWLIEYLYDAEQDQASFAYRSPDRQIGTAKQLVIEGVRYIPKAPNAFVRNEGCLFPSDLGPVKGTRELVAMIESFIYQHYLLENRYLGKIISYYVLMTWVYDAFNALPYLRAMGEPGAGKSELMRRVGYLCYRLLSSSGAGTASSFFRATEMYRGTVFIDEADLHDGGDMSNDLVKFLNLGAMRGNPIWRLEEIAGPDGSKTFEPATFQTFCPKLIAMRKDFRDDAVGSRSLTIKLMPREPVELRARGIRLYIDNDFRRKAGVIRNMLLRWRLQVWEPEIEVSEDFMDLEISSRLNQVTMPLKAIARDDQDLMDEIVRFLRAYNQEMTLTRSMTIAARVVEALWKIYRDPGMRLKYLQRSPEGQEFIMIGDVRTVANQIIDEMNSGGDQDDSEEGKKRRKADQLSARGVGHLIRNELQLPVGERRGNGFPVWWDSLKMTALGKRYGILEPGTEGS